MDNTVGEAHVALPERAAGDARLIAWLAEAADDFESLGAEAAAEFGL